MKIGPGVITERRSSRIRSGTTGDLIGGLLTLAFGVYLVGWPQRVAAWLERDAYMRDVPVFGLFHRGTIAVVRWRIGGVLLVGFGIFVLVDELM